MERKVLERKIVRISFTRLKNQILEDVNSQEPDKLLEAKAKYDNLKLKYEELQKLDREYRALMLDQGEASDENVNKESEASDEYTNSYFKVKNIFDELLKKSKDDNSSPASCENQNRKFKLPKIELEKYDGNLKGWLSFWSMFKKIHEDGSIEEGDKFQYLIQSTVPNSRARELVQSYPATAENYPKVIESLKNRFGKDDVLVELYIRELLSLVIENTKSQSSSSLSSLYDQLESQLRALDSLGIATKMYDAILFPLVESCIPEELLRVWQRHSKIGESPKDRLVDLMAFIRNEVESEQRISMAVGAFNLKKSVVKEKKQSRKTEEEFISTAHDLFSGEKKKEKMNNCIFCRKMHNSQDCFQAQKLSFEEKQNKIRENKACFLCLKVGHRSKACRTNVRCVGCGRRHWVIMCPDIIRNQDKDIAEPERRTENLNASLSNVSCSEEVLLQTLMVNLEANGKRRNVRALIDSGSQRSYILKKTASEFNLNPKRSESLTQLLFGGSSSRGYHNCFEIELQNLVDLQKCTIEVLDQKTICGTIPRLQSKEVVKEIKRSGIPILDMGKNVPTIEILIGADNASKIFTGKMQRLNSGLIAQETCLGWVIMGKISDKEYHGLSTLTVTSLLSQTSNIANLWEMDILGIRDPVETKSRAEMEAAALDHFRKTFSVDKSGRYEVHLPWKESNCDLNDNKDIAEKRCISMSLKLKREGKYEDYDAVFKDWEKSGIIEIVPDEELGNISHYLPHRAIFKENSTTKLRPVFDASCHGKGLPSLNDCLEKGPNLLEEIPPILMRFRKDKIGVIADIKKAFLQISVAKEDCDFLRFPWWENFEKRKMKVFRHRRLVFGLSCSPFLLAAVLNHCLDQRPDEMRETADILKRSFYVDNCVTSLPNQEELETFIDQSKSLLEGACFDLRGWEHSTNHGLSAGKPVSVLGLLWDKDEDSLFCDLTTVKEPKVIVTKRSVLSAVHKIFDPLGILCPVTVTPKLIVQQTWNLKIGWDTELPEEIRNKFEDWEKDLGLLSRVKIPRCLDVCKSNIELSLHIFTDASQYAYSAVIFLRRVDEETTVHFIQAKSRIAPLHRMTIPRLELLACCIGARLAQSVIKAMDFQDCPITYWTDSSTALSWIKREEHWGVFVNNRVKEIRTLSSSKSWRHVPGDRNPADLPSRGCSIKAYLKSYWWEGPRWLREDEKDWPTSEVQTDELEVDKEKRRGVLASTLVSTEAEEKWYNRRFSKYTQIVRMIAWILRFANNSLKPNNKITEELLISELEIAEKKLVKMIQREYFKESECQQLKSLCTFHDDDGILRMKTKITRRADENDFLCPMILPSKNDVVDKLIHERHLQMSHAGAQAVLTNVRQQFWILRGRKTVQRVITRCVRCRRHAAKGVESIPTPLPEDRIRDALVFEVTGLDLAGPLYLKNGDKSWILLFTCAVYRAVHFELLQSVSTNCFILGLRRFIARRGRPKVIYSDNGSNFVGAENLMKTINWEQIVRDTSIYRIQWKFNPPAAPWWGGWWERIVQMVKNLLKRILGKASLGYEEMLTILCDVESVINARPLTYVSDDPKDLVPLSPSFFIQDIRTVGVPDLDHLDKVNISKKFRYQQRLREEFRKRFRDEYLSLLVQPPVKKNHLIREIKEGDIVLIKCDKKKRIDWPLGRVVTLYPGRDNFTRVVKVKTANGDLTRPVQRLYPLEISCNDELCKKANVPKTETVEQSVTEHSDVTDSISKTRYGRAVKRPKRFED